MKGTIIQWTDDTVNAIMGCGGCELFPPASVVLREVDLALSGLLPQWSSGYARIMYREVIRAAYEAIRRPVLGHTGAITTTNIVHTTPWLAEQLSEKFGPAIGTLLDETVKRLIKCYAAKLHLNRGASIMKPDRKANPGYAATFEMMRTYEGRALKSAKASDLFGQSRPTKPWANGLPRMIFVGDMGDTFARTSDFEFLAADLLPAITGESGRRHIWQVLTKRPKQLAAFARRFGAFPEHVICMTTVTSGETLHRINDLRRVNCSMRGLSIEPLWERLTPESLNLDGIDWVIVGGESGGKEHSKPFHLEWARELRDLCRQAGVAFFLKQLGSNPVESGQPVKLSNAHGGDWQEWPEDLRVREFPEGFHSYRRLAEAA